MRSRRGRHFQRLVVLLASLASLARPGAAQTCLENPVRFSTTDAEEGDAPFAVVTCDFDQDGNPDLATANDASDTLSVLLNDGTGAFVARRRWSVGPPGVRSEPVDLACCDLNRDGLLDLVTANHTSDDISVLFGEGLVEGTPRFSEAQRHPVGEAPWAVRCARINADDHLDLLIANFTDDNVAVLINDGAGGVDPAASYSIGVGDAPRALAVCDLDTDGDLDVLTANLAGKSVSVLVNGGDSGLNDAGEIPLGVNPFGLACGELDGIDGPDIVVANIVDDSITVLRNTGGGAFSGPARTGGVDGASNVILVDADGDGALDVVSTNLGSDGISILRNLGDGTLDAPLFITVGDNPSSAAAAGLVRGGGWDLVVAYADGVAVLANSCTSAGDLNEDGFRDLADLAVFQTCMGEPSWKGPCPRADLDSDGVIGLGDYAMLAPLLNGPCPFP